jgi:hypothetical protein
LAADDARIAYMPRDIGSFRTGGASSQLEQGQKETYDIQNAFPLYREPQWMEKRLHIFQRELLAHRIRASRYDAALGRIDGVKRLFSALRCVIRS